MPNRVIRESILDSDRVNQLSWPGEIFYRRLMSVVDDFGRCDARSELLRSKLYPLRLGVVSSSDIVKWLDECSRAGLIRQYTISNREYLEILNFNQTVRIKKGKVPPPLKSDACKCEQMHADDCTCMSETKRNESETELADASLYVNGNVPRGRFEIDSYPDGKAAFEEMQSDDQFVERLVRVVHNEGYPACQPIEVMKAVRRFITAEEAKPDFPSRPRSEVRKHLVNWIRKSAKTLNA